jgi:hypothetical protein
MFVLYKAGDFPGWPFSLTVSELAAALLVAFALLRTPQLRPVPGRAYYVPVLLFAVWVGIVILVTGTFSVTRVGHLALWALLGAVIIFGRVHTPSLARGMGLGIVIGTVYGVVRLGSSSYAGRMTGLFGDPNTGGMILVASAAMCIALLERRSSRIVVGGVAFFGIYMTQSRTTLFAAAMVLLWVLLGRWLHAWFAVAAMTVVVTAVPILGAMPWASRFFEGREGSDILRTKILAAEDAKVAASPWLGHGPGQGTVYVPEGRKNFFFHNSYLSGVAEFGWIGVGLVLLLAAVVVIFAIRKRRGNRSIWVEGAVLALLICSQQLGEVLFALPMTMALGLLVRASSPPPSRVVDQGPSVRVAGRARP